MKLLGAIVLPIAFIGITAPAFAADGLPESGSAKLAAYQVCHTLAALDMGSAGAQSSTECSGIVRNTQAQTAPDNLAIHCLESTGARPDGYRYVGSCVLLDSDNDKLFMTYNGKNNGELKWLGGTGKYKDVEGSGTLGVVVAPGGADGSFAYTLNLDVNWTHKPK